MTGRFRAAKNETALDHYQARKHTAWYRHVTLAMCACAWLAVTAAGHPPPRVTSSAGPVTATPRERGRRACERPSALPPGNRDQPASSGREGPLIGLTVNEIRRMHAILRRPAHPPERHLRWSAWRRRHQARARHCHYQRRRERYRV